MLSTICKRLNLRQRVVASANIFFRRFFGKNSYSALDPFLVAATCAYVAAKVEESPIHIKSAVAEAARTFQEVGFRSMPTDNSSLAEMEFYLLEEMEFDMIIFHPYRSLISLYDNYGTAKDGSGGSGSGGGNGLGLGLEGEAFGVIKGLQSVEERDAMGAGLVSGVVGAGVGGGEDGSGMVKLAEFDEQVLQMAWFVLNDCYKSDIPLMYPPYMVALASLWLALTLHTPSYDRINSSLNAMQLKRHQHHLDLKSILENPSSTSAQFHQHQQHQPQPQPPSHEALTFFASLNVSLPLLAEVVQEMVSGYQLQNQVRTLLADGPGMVKLLERMREARRLDLVTKSRSQPSDAAAAAATRMKSTAAHR